MKAIASSRPKAKSGVSAFFGSVGRFFAQFGEAVAKGDLFVKLSLIWWGAGYARRKQFVKAAIMTVLEALVIWFTAAVSVRYVPKFGTLGTVQLEQVFDPVTMKMVANN